MLMFHFILFTFGRSSLEVLILRDSGVVSRATRSKPSSKIGENESLQELTKQPLGCDSTDQFYDPLEYLPMIGHKNSLVANQSPTYITLLP